MKAKKTKPAPKLPLDLVWQEDVRAQMVVPGRSKPIAPTAFRDQLKKLGVKIIKPNQDGPKRGFVTKADANMLLAQFKLLHWRLFRGAAGVK
jgi:hypothetical protein